MIFVSIVVDKEAEVQSCQVACPRAPREEVGGRAGCDLGSLTPAPLFFTLSDTKEYSIQPPRFQVRKQQRLRKKYLAQSHTAE